MWYNSHKDRAGVSEFFFWYQLTRVVLDKQLLNGLFLLLLFLDNGEIGQTQVVKRNVKQWS